MFRATLRTRIIALFISLFILVGSDILYSTHNSTFPVASQTISARPAVTNAYVLEDRLPSSVIAYSMARVNDYLRANDIQASSTTVTGSIATNPDTYNFTLQLNPHHGSIGINIDVQNDNATISSSVSINGHPQTPVVPGTGANTNLSTTSYSGFSALVDNGVTAIQSNELLQALEQFSPNARSVTIDTSTIAANLPPADQGGLETFYTFSVVIDSTTYNAKFTTNGLYDSHLLLNDTHGKQVFDSGPLSQGS